MTHKPPSSESHGFLRVTAALLGALASAVALGPGPSTAGAEGALHEAVFVGNNWDGTASVLDPEQGYEEIARINIVPDKDERMLEIMLNPVDYVYFLAIREAIGEGHDQFVDDMYTTPDGELLIVSRPSFKDVVALSLDDCADLSDCEIAWRFEVDGQRSDHMGISPDGSQVAVSASTGNVVHILDTETGQEVDRFASGDSPHENTYSADGERLYHASIGRVYTPNREGNPILSSSKGERVFYVLDADDYDVIDDIDVRKALDDAGHPELSEAVRPMAVTRNEKKVFFQVSFFHGFVAYSFAKDKVTKVVDLPNEVPNMPPEQYVLNSAHHGIALNGKGNRLCVAGTMDDYVAIVKRKHGFPHKILRKGEKPYWSTTSRDGRKCYVSWSGTDSLSVISYGRRKEIAHIPVGDHPQRVRTGSVTESWLAAHDD